MPVVECLLCVAATLATIRDADSIVIGREQSMRIPEELVLGRALHTITTDSRLIRLGCSR